MTLSPILPGVLIIAVTIWQFRASDEYIRTKILSAAATSAVITAVWTLAYGYLELVGLPRLSMGWVSNVGWFVFVALMLRLMFSREERTA